MQLNQKYQDEGSLQDTPFQKRLMVDKLDSAS